MDGHGWGEAANDDGSGTALVMEVARVFSSPDVQTERSIRFALWNNEETGLNGARAYVDQRKDLQGKEDPAGSGKYPEPKWLGMIQHDMMMFDHGMPREDGTVSKEQRPEADVNIEFQTTAKLAQQAQALAWVFQAANEKYATDYPAAIGSHMTNTDSTPFMDLVPAISLRENERGTQIGSGWDPHWHQPTDVYRHLQRQGLPPRPERGTDDARRARAADRRDSQVAREPCEALRDKRTARSLQRRRDRRDHHDHGAGAEGPGGAGLARRSGRCCRPSTRTS